MDRLPADLLVRGILASNVHRSRKQMNIALAGGHVCFWNYVVLLGLDVDTRIPDFDSALAWCLLLMFEESLKIATLGQNFASMCMVIDSP